MQDEVPNLNKLRMERDLLLKESDWVVIKAQETGTSIPSAWATYRQELRDITNTYKVWMMMKALLFNKTNGLIMEIDAMLFWNIILTMVVVPAGWAFNKMFQEVKRLQILLNKTREEYARKDDIKEDIHDLMDAIKRLEDKLDKILIGAR